MTLKSRRAWFEGAKWTIYAVVAFAVAVYVAVNYEGAIRKVNWSLVSIIAGGALCALAFYRWSSDKDNTFEPLDLVLDPVTRRVSPWRVIVLTLFGVGLWILGQWVLKDKPASDIINLFTILMTAFVGKLVSSDWSDVVAKRDVSVAPDPEPGKGEPR